MSLSWIEVGCDSAREDSRARDFPRESPARKNSSPPMTSPWFGISHESVAITLRAGAEEKVLHLSPVVLSMRCAFFAARFRPGGNDWAPVVLEVESVKVAAALLESFHAIGERARWSEVLSDWSDFPPLFALMDQWQMSEDSSVVEAASAAKSMLCDIGNIICATEPRDEKAGSSIAVNIIEDLVRLRAASFGRSPAFDDLVHSAVNLARVVKGRKFSKAELDSLSTGAKVEVLFDALRGFEDAIGCVDEAAINIAESLRDAKDDRDALPYLEEMTRADRPFERVRFRNGGVIQRAIDILGEIQGDEIAGSAILRARDKFIIMMLGVNLAVGRAGRK